MYQQIMVDVHRQWLAEFDRQQAIRRQLARQPRERGSAMRALATLLRLWRRERQPVLAGRLPQASQCL